MRTTRDRRKLNAFLPLHKERRSCLANRGCLVPLKGSLRDRPQCWIPISKHLTASSYSKGSGMTELSISKRSRKGSFSISSTKMSKHGASLSTPRRVEMIILFSRFDRDIIDHCKLRHSQPELARESTVTSGRARDSRTSKRFLH